MILYDLICDNDHEFESWFKSSSAFDSLQKKKAVTCPQCGTAKVRKAPMAPRLSRATRKGVDQVPAPLESDPTPPPLETTEDVTAVMTKAVEAIKELQATIEKNFENVGDKFPEEARKIHYGEAESRGIYGEASAEEAEALVEEGIDIAAVPWQKRRTS